MILKLMSHSVTEILLPKEGKDEIIEEGFNSSSVSIDKVAKEDKEGPSTGGNCVSLLPGE